MLLSLSASATGSTPRGASSLGNLAEVGGGSIGALRRYQAIKAHTARVMRCNGYVPESNTLGLCFLAAAANTCPMLRLGPLEPKFVI